MVANPYDKGDYKTFLLPLTLMTLIADTRHVFSILYCTMCTCVSGKTFMVTTARANQTMYVQYIVHCIQQ